MIDCVACVQQVVVMIAFGDDIAKILKIAKQNLSSKGRDYASYVWMIPTDAQASPPALRSLYLSPVVCFEC